MSVCVICSSKELFVTMGHRGDGSEGVPVCKACCQGIEDLYENPKRCQSSMRSLFEPLCTRKAVIAWRMSEDFSRIMCRSCWIKGLIPDPEREAAIRQAVSKQ